MQMRCIANPSAYKYTHGLTPQPHTSEALAFEVVPRPIELAIPRRSRRMPWDTSKTSWPEVVGWPATQAVTQINADRPDVAIEVIPNGTTVAPGYNAERVRVFFDAGNASGPVVGTPAVG
ncbi:hypothetical protein ZWY2020_049958 [Hordeum vulgare]|nr:hypothetical protein ZWY2020_049958 [Hordeum vulgare]